MKEICGPSDFERKILEEANKVIGEINGSPITEIDRLLLILKSKTDKPEIAKFVIQLYKDTLKEEQERREAMVRDLLMYKEKWGPIFDAHKKAGQTPPNVYPDPNDIVIKDDLSFEFIGPITSDEARQWESLKRGREAFFMLAREILENKYMSIEEAYAHWAKLRRKFYRINRHFPKNFKRKYPARFPPFEPAARHDD